jgi:hypothetical protein
MAPAFFGPNISVHALTRTRFIKNGSIADRPQVRLPVVFPFSSTAIPGSYRMKSPACPDTREKNFDFLLD